MSVSITLSKPYVVAQGGSWDDHHWGPYQFPALYRADDGRFLATYHTHIDSVDAYGKANPVCVSEDGEHWTETDDPALIAQIGDLLPSGDRISVIATPPVPFDDARLPKPLNREKYRDMGEKVYLIDDIPGRPFEHKWPFKRLPAGKREPVTDYSDVIWPNMFVNKVNRGAYPGILPPFAINGHTRIAPDGTIWRTVEERCAVDPVNGGFNPFYCVYYFTSNDNARTFTFRSWIPYSPDTRENPNAFFVEGFNEGDISFMPDGSMITLLRTDSTAPSYIARSTDNGFTWSKPTIFDRIGVWPNLCTLRCGVTLASYGRPGLYLRATDDPTGMSWDDPIEIVPGEISAEKVKNLESGYFGTEGISLDLSRFDHPTTCAYSAMIETGDNSALYLYSDFNYPDANGKPCKTILSRKITVS